MLPDLETSEPQVGIDRPPIRLSFLTIMPSPYMQDLFELVSRDPRFQLRVYYMEMVAPDTHWGKIDLPDYAEVLWGKWFWLLGGRIHVNPGAGRKITASRPDVVVIAGYSGLTNQLVMRSLSRQRVPWIFYGELPGMHRRGPVGRVLRAAAQRPMIRRAAAIAAVGSKAAKIYQSLARRDCPVVSIPYCCDVQQFFKTELRTASQHGIRFLYCGQLIDRKGVDLLLAAFLAIAGQFPGTTLTLVGDGPQRDELIRVIPRELASRVRFAGFQPVNQLPTWFGRADVLVLPSRHDGWGVVVNQAIAAGLAIVCSDAVGAAHDLIEREHNGLIFTSGDGAELTKCLALLAKRPELVAKMGCRSRELALNWTPEQAVHRWYDLCRQVISRHGQITPAARRQK